MEQRGAMATGAQMGGAAGTVTAGAEVESRVAVPMAWPKAQCDPKAITREMPKAIAAGVRLLRNLECTTGRNF